MDGLIGKKIGMTRVFDEKTGQTTAITIVHVGSNVVQQVKTVAVDGYSAFQVGFGSVKEKKLKKSELGHFAKHGKEFSDVVKEFSNTSGEEIAPGTTFGVELLEGIKYVDVAGISKGRGYAGTIKRYNFQRGRETHGNTNRRDRGSLGAGTYPARVFPGLKMAGQYGNSRVTVKGIEVFGIDKSEGLVYLKGAIPGANRGVVFLKKNNTKK